MKRREFVKKISIGAVAAGGALSACGRDPAPSGGAPAAASAPRYKWSMVTTWLKDFPGLGTGANLLAKLIGEMSDGRLQVTVYGQNELVPASEVFDAVAQGTAEMGHGSAYYWKGKNPAFQFFSTVPFGLTAQELNSWLHHGGGWELWRDAYAPFNLVPFAAGNSGVQMGGWFNREINSMEDFKGLKMRIPGLGGEVFKRAGGTPVNIKGGEIFTALQTGVIDATEWVGPYNDLAFGFHKIAKYYYYPGWHEPGTAMECIVNKKQYDALPKDLQSIVRAACRVANQSMLDEYTANNNAALNTLLNEHKVQLRRFPDDVMERLRGLADEVVQELAGKSDLARSVYDSYSKFRDQVMAWQDISERAYLNLRAKGQT